MAFAASIIALIIIILTVLLYTVFRSSKTTDTPQGHSHSFDACAVDSQLFTAAGFPEVHPATPSPIRSSTQVQDLTALCNYPLDNNNLIHIGTYNPASFSSFERTFREHYKGSAGTDIKIRHTHINDHDALILSMDMSPMAFTHGIYLDTGIVTILSHQNTRGHLARAEPELNKLTQLIGNIDKKYFTHH